MQEQIMKRLGKYTLLFERRPSILGHAAVCGKKEAQGPLANDFDQTFEDSYLACKSWEKAESALQTQAVNLAIHKAGLNHDDINMIFAGDLLNQCICSSFTLRRNGRSALWFSGSIGSPPRMERP